jgi:hypothetical protein
MDSEKVEGLCFPLLFPHGEPGYTYFIKSCLSPDEYVMAMMLRPEKIHGEYMTAQASYTPFQCIDIHTGELFAPTKDQYQVKANQVQGVLIRHLLRVNCFMLMAQLAQYWLMDFYSRVLNQRMSIMRKIKPGL